MFVQLRELLKSSVLIETETYFFAKEHPLSTHERWQECANNSKNFERVRIIFCNLRLKTKERHEFKHPHKAVNNTIKTR